MRALCRRLGVRRLELSPSTRVRLTLLAVGVWCLLQWLDSPASPVGLHGSPRVHEANVFAAIWAGIQILAGWVAAAAEVTAAYVWIALQWLAAAVGTFLKSTGAMFAKVWEGLKIVWSDVLRPALVWLDDHLKRIYAWLKDTFKPVFDFLREVRCRLNEFYTTFVRPVVDTIEFIRQINRVLLVFHVGFLKQLDGVLQRVEQRIEEPILWINAKLNEVWHALDLVVTANGFFQKVTLIRSMSRYAPTWMRIATNARTRPLTGAQQYAITRARETQTVPQITADLRTHLQGGAVNIGEVIDQATERARAYYESA
jgi:hypothetical protein